MNLEPIFQDYQFGPTEKARLDTDGHLLYPGLLTPAARVRLTAALTRIEALQEQDERARPYAAEHDTYLASLIAHPQMLELARNILGPDIRFDHCVSLVRPANNAGLHWHSHDYADARPELGFVRIFFYVNGFSQADGGLKVVPGSHLFRDASLRAETDAELCAGWLAGKQHPQTGKPLEIEQLDAPSGTVALMWTHAAHAVSPRQPHSPTRWTVVYAYRNPGEISRARWLSETFEREPPPGAAGLMSLY